MGSTVRVRASIYNEVQGHPLLPGQTRRREMSGYPVERNSGGFTRIRAYVGNLFGDGTSIDKLSQQPRPDPASEGLNRPYDLSDLMRQTFP